MNLLTRNDPRMECVRKFERKRAEKGRSSCLTDAICYAEQDFKMKFEPLDNDFVVHYEKDGENVTTSDKEVVKKILKQNAMSKLLENLCASTWQGKILDIRMKDPDINLGECFYWLTKWKDAPVEVINNFHSIYLQTVPTLTFKKFRGERSISSTMCRLCSQGVESVKHLMSNCQKFLAHAYKRRHDRVLQHILFKFLHKNNMISELPAWYTKICIKPVYKNEEIEVYWDIPEYSGYGDDLELEHGPLRPDGKVINKAKKAIFVLEMSIPWIDHRSSKSQEKDKKYIDIVQNLKIQNPEYVVQQLTFIVDCLGGYSKELREKLHILGLTKSEIDSILPGVQKILVIEANSVINHFKILTVK